jgi:hypothetical protein
MEQHMGSPAPLREINLPDAWDTPPTAITIPHLEGDAGLEGPLFCRLDEAMMAAARHPFGPAGPPSGGTFRRVGIVAARRLPARMPRRRGAGRPAARRTSRVGARASSDDPAPSSEPPLGRRYLAGVAR